MADDTTQKHPDDVALERARREWTAWRCDWERALVSFPGLSATDLATGIEIARHGRAESRKAWPSQALLANNLGRSVASVEKAVRRLVGLGFLKVERHPANNGHAFNVYILQPDRIDAFLDQREALKDARVEGDAAMGKQLVDSWKRSCRQEIKKLNTHPSDLTGGTTGQPIQSEGCDPYDPRDKHLGEHVSYISSEEEDYLGRWLSEAS